MCKKATLQRLTKPISRLMKRKDYFLFLFWGRCIYGAVKRNFFDTAMFMVSNYFSKDSKKATSKQISVIRV